MFISKVSYAYFPSELIDGGWGIFQVCLEAELKKELFWAYQSQVSQSSLSFPCEGHLNFNIFLRNFISEGRRENVDGF